MPSELLFPTPVPLEALAHVPLSASYINIISIIKVESSQFANLYFFAAGQADEKQIYTAIFQIVTPGHRSFFVWGR